MRRTSLVILLLTTTTAIPRWRPAAGEERADPVQESDTVQTPIPVMVDVSEQDSPSEAEWASLQDENKRSLFGGGGLDDFSSKRLRVNGTRYWTANATEGTVASYGKKISGKQECYDRMGHIAGVSYSIDGNSWKARYVVNSEALVKLTGDRFEEFAGVSVDAAGRKQIEISFVVVDVPKDEVIRRLNLDIEALEYFDALHSKARQHRSRGIKKILAKEPPSPRVVLGNVMILAGDCSRTFEASIDGAIHALVSGDSVKLLVHGKNGETTSYQSPVVRCYRMYTVEFKTDEQGNLVRRELVDSQGRTHDLPQVFDLTPEP
jgi:hypothetical protein